MLASNKNLKDEAVDLDIPIKDNFLSISYTKANKLITALYMVTDIIDKGEPIRNKLRHLGVEIISDIHSIPTEASNKIAETVSFLNIASAMNLISEMNCSILKKEFLELSQCIKEFAQTKPTWLEEFLENSSLEGWSKTGEDKSIPPPSKGYSSREELNSKGHTRIGVQKGSTLMKALSDKTRLLFNSNSTNANKNYFNILKKQRRDNIINIIKNKGGNATIKDIKIKINAGIQGALTFSEKTLQRELMSMIKDGVLNKTGEKRWSRYFLK